MPTYIRVKDLPNSASSLNADDYIMLSGSVGGARKILKSDFLNTVADEFEASPSTYKLATLDASNKLNIEQLPASAFSYQGTWAASTNTPTLANGSGTAGHVYYASDSGSVNFGAGSISFSTGDAVVYDGSIWQKVPDVANILDGKGTVDEGKTTLEIPNVGTAANEVSTNGQLGDLAFQSSAGVVVDDLTVDGHFTGVVGKPMPVNGPTMRFDGSNDFVDFAYSASHSFTNAGGDTAFSGAGWVKKHANDQVYLISKRDDSLREYIFQVSATGQIYLELFDSSNNTAYAYTAAAAVNDYEWTHVAFTFSASSAVGLAANDITIYTNGAAQPVTAYNAGGYTGMTDNSKPLWVQKAGSSIFGAGEIRDAKLFNKELSAAEVREVYSNGQLPESFAESTGTSALNTGTFANSTTSSRQFGAITGASATGFTAAYNNSNTNNRIAAPLSSAVITGKKYKATFTVNTAGADVILRFFNATTLENTGSGNETINTTTATSVSYEWTETGSGDRIGFIDNSPAASGSLVVSDFRIIQIGSVLDARAENYNQSAGKLLDVSGNGFVGDQSGGVELLTPRSHLSAGTLDLTNLPTSATGLSAGEVYNSSGTLKIV